MSGLRIAVVLFNLGGPDDAASVRPFLFNLFNDPAIIGLPGFLGMLGQTARKPHGLLKSLKRTREVERGYDLVQPIGELLQFFNDVLVHHAVPPLFVDGHSNMYRVGHQFCEQRRAELGPVPQELERR